jgi:hypothetical protein
VEEKRDYAIFAGINRKNIFLVRAQIFPSEGTGKQYRTNNKRFLHSTSYIEQFDVSLWATRRFSLSKSTFCCEYHFLTNMTNPTGKEVNQ